MLYELGCAVGMIECSYNRECGFDEDRCDVAFRCVRSGVLLNRKQLEQLMKTTFGGVRANLPAHGSAVGFDRERRSCFCSCSSCQFEIRSAA